MARTFNEVMDRFRSITFEDHSSYSQWWDCAGRDY